MYDSAQEFRWMLLYRNGYELCPAADRPPNNPAVEASEYWRVFGEDLLPKPQPRIQPGYMLTGKLAYLEARSQPTAHFEHATPIGTLVIDATATLWVDWGDGGGLKGPITAPDGPWPDGKVTGFWTNAGTYDVQVVQQWSATWQLGGRSGDLRDLRTEGVIEDFEVQDLQAVRNR